MHKLLALRHPNITYVFDAFEFRDTFYIITERCYCPLTDLLHWTEFKGPAWLTPIARCLLQAVHYIHINGYAHQDIHPGNVFAAFAKDEMLPTEPGVIQFKVGDLGVAKLFGDPNPTNTRAQWMLPPEAFEPAEFGPLDHRIDIYHVGLLLLQLVSSRELQFTKEEILAGRPREMAVALSPPYSFAVEKALRRHVASGRRAQWNCGGICTHRKRQPCPAAAGEAREPAAAEQPHASGEPAPAGGSAARG